MSAITVAAVAAACALLVRLLKAAEPLWTRIPEAWRWVPPVLLSVCMSDAVAGAAGGATWQDLATATVTGIVAGLAAIGGREATLRAAGKRSPGETDDLPENPYKGAPPGATGLLLLIMIGAALHLSACSGSFELARGQGAAERGVVRTQVTYRATPAGSAASAAVPADKKRCQELDDNHQRFDGQAKFWGAIAGGSGLTAVPVDDKGWKIGLGITAAVAAAISIAAEVMAADSATSWARECSSP